MFLHSDSQWHSMHTPVEVVNSYHTIDDCAYNRHRNDLCDVTILTMAPAHDLTPVRASIISLPQRANGRNMSAASDMGESENRREERAVISQNAGEKRAQCPTLAVGHRSSALILPRFQLCCAKH